MNLNETDKVIQELHGKVVKARVAYIQNPDNIRLAELNKAHFNLNKALRGE